MSGISLALTKVNPAGINLVSKSAPISLQTPNVSIASAQTTLSGGLLTGGDTVVAGALTAVLPSGGNNSLGYTKFTNNIDVGNTVNAPNANLTTITATNITALLNATVKGALSVTGDATVSGSTGLQSLSATTTTLAGVLTCQTAVNLATTLTVGTSLTVPSATIQNLAVQKSSMTSIVSSSLTANGTDPLTLTGKDSAGTVIINSLLQTSNIQGQPSSPLQLTGLDAASTTDVVGRLTVDKIQPHTASGTLSLSCPVAFTSTMQGPTSVVQNAYIQNNASTDPTVSATLSFSRLGYNSAYTGSIGMQPNVGLQTKVNGTVVTTINPTNNLCLFPTTVQLSNPLQANGVVATGSSPLVLQGADGLLTVDCPGLLKADTWRAHTSGGNVTIGDPLIFGSATGSSVVANSVFVQNLTSSDASVNSYTSYNRSGFNSALTASTGISPSKGGYVLNVNGRQVFLADTGVGNVTFAQGLIVQGGETIAGGLTVAGSTVLSTTGVNGVLTVSGSIALPDLLSNFTGKLSQIKNDGVAFNPNATSDLYMNNYNIYTATTVNGVTSNFNNSYVQNLTSSDVTVKALTAYNRSGYNTAYTASHGVDPSKGYVLNVNGRNVYTADVTNGNVVFSQGVGVTNNLTVSGGFNYTPPGVIWQWAAASAPVGFLICDGSAISRTGYAALYAIIGTAYGIGDGSSTFNIPNLQSRVAVGRNTGNGSFASLGQAGGEAAHTLSLNEMPSHSHAVSDPGHNHGLNDPEHGHELYQPLNTCPTGQQANSHLSPSSEGPMNYPGSKLNGGGQPWIVGTNSTGISLNAAQTGLSISSTGAGQAHNILQPYLVLNYIIKV